MFKKGQKVQAIRAIDEPAAGRVVDGGERGVVTGVTGCAPGYVYVHFMGTNRFMVRADSLGPCRRGRPRKVR